MGRGLPFYLILHFKKGIGYLTYMKKINKILIFTILGYVLTAFCINMWLQKSTFSSNNKEYKVSINRIEKAVNDFENIYNSAPDNLSVLTDFSGDKYKSVDSLSSMKIKDITNDEQKRFFHEDISEYMIITTTDYFYKVTYTPDNRINYSTIIVINVITGIIFLACILFILYIKHSIIIPFHILSNVPYELSKGNLTIPLKENKNKLFGKFVWGMDLLRENLEENKAHELTLQKEKKVLLLSLSHDIKTPLSAIKLYAKALSKNLYKSEDKKKEIAENISCKVDEIESYISEIVKASNEDFLSFDVNNQEFYIKQVLNKICKYYDDKMKLNQIDFTIGNYSNCLVYGDSDRLVEVIQNVIENAIKYGNGKKIWIESSRNEEEYTISISNTGCTLCEKELTHIFDSFFRGSNVEKQPGSGLGLYICRCLMHLMEGEITAFITEEETLIMTIQISLHLA